MSRPLYRIFATLLLAVFLLTLPATIQGRTRTGEEALEQLRRGIDWRDDAQLELFEAHGRKLHDARRPVLHHADHGDSLTVPEAAPSVAVELRLKDVVFSDGVIELGAGGSSPGVHCGVHEPWGLRFRASKAGHYLLGVLGSQVALYRIRDGIQAKLASSGYRYSSDEVAPELRVEAEGPTIRVYHYDELFAEVQDDAFTEGWISIDVARCVAFSSTYLRVDDEITARPPLPNREAPAVAVSPAAAVLPASGLMGLDDVPPETPPLRRIEDSLYYHHSIEEIERARAGGVEIDIPSQVIALERGVRFDRTSDLDLFHEDAYTDHRTRRPRLATDAQGRSVLSVPASPHADPVILYLDDFELAGGTMELNARASAVEGCEVQPGRWDVEFRDGAKVAFVVEFREQEGTMTLRMQGPSRGWRDVEAVLPGPPFGERELLLSAAGPQVAAWLDGQLVGGGVNDLLEPGRVGIRVPGCTALEISWLRVSRGIHELATLSTMEHQRVAQVAMPEPKPEPKPEPTPEPTPAPQEPDPKTSPDRWVADGPVIRDSYAGHRWSSMSDDVSWAEAAAWCESVWVTSYHHWRLPTIRELRELNLECEATAVDGACPYHVPIRWPDVCGGCEWGGRYLPPAFPYPDGRYWSSTSGVYDGQVWTYDTRNAGVYTTDTDEQHRVLCIHE